MYRERLVLYSNSFEHSQVLCSPSCRGTFTTAMESISGKGAIIGTRGQDRTRTLDPYLEDSSPELSVLRLSNLSASGWLRPANKADTQRSSNRKLLRALLFDMTVSIARTISVTTAYRPDFVESTWRTTMFRFRSKYQPRDHTFAPRIFRTRMLPRTPYTDPLGLQFVCAGFRTSKVEYSCFRCIASHIRW